MKKSKKGKIKFKVRDKEPIVTGKKAKKKKH